MDYMDYREKLGLGFSDKEKQKIFMQRVCSYLKQRSDCKFSDEQEQEFCYSIGVECYVQNDPLGLDIDLYAPSGLQRAEIYLKKKLNNFPDFLSAIMILANRHCATEEDQEDLIDAIKKAFKDSHIPISILYDEDGTFIFPKGAKELDDALVSEPLEWMAAYPNSRTAFVKALKAYSSAKEETASAVADQFRKALESFFQEFFGSSKSLENYKSEYGTYLDNHGVPKEISGNFATLLMAYTNYINNFAKHHDRAHVNVLEYLMYQTGNIIRLLITLDEGDRI